MRDLALSPFWSWRFRDLKAEVLIRQDLNRDALTLLEQAPPPDLASKDVVVWRKMLQAEASYNLNQFDDAGMFLSEAETLASANSPELLGEVKLREGTLASLRNDLSTAETEYKAALRLARGQHDQFLEISCLGNLGIVATQAEHYDEAIDWNRSALKLGQNLGAQSYNATILGNIGWSYFEMGDYENALSLLQEADSASGRLGLVSAQVDWETDMGNVYYQLHDYRSAERAYQGAYDLAKSVDYELGIAQSMGNLAFVALDKGQPDSAKHYSVEFASFLSGHPNGQLELYELLIAGRIHELKHEYADAEILFNATSSQPLKPKHRFAGQLNRGLQKFMPSKEGARKQTRQFRRSIETIAEARTGIKTEEFRLSFLSSAIELYNDYIEFLVSQGNVEAALRVAEVSRAQTLAEGLGIGSKISFPFPNFQPRLIAQRFGATLLFYWLGEKRSYLWIITRSGVSLIPLPPRRGIEPILRAYRASAAGSARRVGDFERRWKETVRNIGRSSTEADSARFTCNYPAGWRIVRSEFRDTSQSEAATPLLDRGYRCRDTRIRSFFWLLLQPTGGQSKEAAACGQSDLAERGVSGFAASEHRDGGRGAIFCCAGSHRAFATARNSNRLPRQ